MKPRVGAGLLILGTIVLGFGIISFPHPFVTGYHHTITTYDNDEMPSTKPVVEFGNLSTNGQSVFLDALNDKSGEKVIYSSTGKPNDFTYSHDIHRYIIVHKGTPYKLTARLQDNFFPIRGIQFLSILIVGIGIIISGWLQIKQELEGT